MGEIFNKSAIVISESHKSSYITQFLGNRPVHDGTDFLGVNLQAVWGDYNTKLFCGSLVKLTLLGFYLEACPLQ